MSQKRPRRGRGVDLRGRSTREPKHVRFYQTEMATLAYRSLPLGARCLLKELKLLYNTMNNGKLFISIRYAAVLLNAGKSSVADWYIDLQDRGFIRPASIATFDFKAGASSGKATTWILTEFEYNNQLPTRDYRNWVPGPDSQRVPEIISRSALKDGSYPTPDTLYPTPDTYHRSVRPQGQFEADSTESRPPTVPEAGRI
jgi:hypothetical protein